MAQVAYCFGGGQSQGEEEGGAEVEAEEEEGVYQNLRSHLFSISDRLLNPEQLHPAAELGGLEFVNGDRGFPDR
jgi:hypothetical protein